MKATPQSQLLNYHFWPSPCMPGKMESTTAGANLRRPRKRLRRKKPPRRPPPAAVPLVNDLGDVDLRRCHACGGGPSPLPLEFLDSLWRIVPVCRRCVLSLHSSSLCSYCFQPIPGGGSGLACVQCGRSAHPGCLAADPPSPGAFVCLDCWVPPAYASRYSKDRKASDFGDGSSSLEKVVRSAHATAEKAAVLAAEARSLDDRKAMRARSAAELAKSAMDCTAARGGKVKSASGLGNGRVFGDKEVALLLHRAINCSPRFYSRRQRGSLNSVVLPSPVIEKPCTPIPRWENALSPPSSEADSSNLCESDKEECEDGDTNRYGKTYTRKRFRAEVTEIKTTIPTNGLACYRRKNKLEAAESLEEFTCNESDSVPVVSVGETICSKGGQALDVEEA